MMIIQKAWHVRLIAIICIFIISFTGILLLVPQAYGVHNTSSVVGDFFTKTFGVSLTKGGLPLDSQKQNDDRNALNSKILNKKQDQKVSLYDRFGGDINFIGYYGELRIQTNGLDKFYSMLKYHSSPFSWDSLRTFMSKPEESNNTVYYNRPEVLDQNSIATGGIDPRASAYSPVSLVGGQQALGGFALTIAKILISFITFFASNTISDTIFNLYQSMFGGKGQMTWISNIIHPIIFLAWIAFVMWLLVTAFKYYSGKGGSFKKLGGATLSAFISSAIISVMIASPMIIPSLLHTLASPVDSIFTSAINTQGDEVVQSSDKSNIVQASIWETAIFKPWCNAQFGADYDKLYTKFDTTHPQGQYDQSADNVTGSFTGSRYDSKDLTGDVQVPIGNKDVVRNWCALAWSTQSIYHINAVPNEVDAKTKTEETDQGGWPNALTTPLNSNIYVDDFRWIDAQLNISPEYVGKKDDVKNIKLSYNTSRKYTQHFIVQGFYSLFLACLAIIICVFGIKRMWYAIKFIWVSITLIYTSLRNIMQPDSAEYNLLTNMKKIIHPVGQYIWWSVLMYLAIIFYNAIADKGPMGALLYLCMMVVLYRLKPIRLPAQLKRGGKFMQNRTKDAKNIIQNKIKHKMPSNKISSLIAHKRK